MCDQIAELLENLVSRVVEAEERAEATSQQESIDDLNSVCADEVNQVGGAPIKILKTRTRSGPGPFKDHLNFVTLTVELRDPITTHPDGAQRFGDMIKELVENNLPQGSTQSTRVGVVLTSSEWDEGEAVGLSVTPINQIASETIVQSLEKLSQSNKSPLELQIPKIDVTLKYITPPSGSGKRLFTMANILENDYFSKRRRNVEVDAVDDVEMFFDDEAGEEEESDEDEDYDEEELVGGSVKTKRNRTNIMRNDVPFDCLPYALFQAWMHYEKKHGETVQMRDFGRRMLEQSLKSYSPDNPNRQQKVVREIRKMKTEAGITKTTDFDWTDIQAFQDTVFAGKLQIIAVVKDQKTPYFAGPFIAPEKTISIFLDSGKNGCHYSGVRCLPTLLKTMYYCALCDVRSGSFAVHYNCPLRHRPCGALECPQTPEDLELCCVRCTRVFRSRICLENHLAKGPRRGKSRCDLTRRCGKCGEIYFYNKYKVGMKHECGSGWCGRCMARRPKNHHCTLQGSKKQEEKLSRKRIFYDFESRQDEDTGEQVPVLFIALKCCPQCSNKIPENLEAAMEETCDNCSPDGRGKRIDCISDDTRFLDVAEEATEWLFSSQHRKFVAIAHNNSGYDAQFILRSLIKSNKAAPTVVSAGTKIIYLHHKGVKVIDSLKYLTMSLSAIGKAFNTKMEKGDFPIKFIKPENYDYKGPIPDEKYYNLDYKSPDAKQKLLEFLAEERTSGKTFNFEEEIVKYCFGDVFILASALTTFEQDFEKVTDVCLFEESCTAASAAMKVFQRKHHNRLNPIVLDARPSVSMKCSVDSQKYLAWFGKTENVQVNISTTYGEQKIADYRVDGFVDPCPKFPRGLVIEYQGCYWHAHSCKYSDQSCIMNTLACEIRARDAEKLAVLEQLHDVKIIWECEAEMERKVDKDMARFYDDYEPLDILHCERALVGGRTEVFRLHQKNDGFKLYYGDFCSLYPTVMKQHEYPVGPPTNVPRATFTLPLTTSKELKLRGFLNCRVLAPRKLKLPVLPIKLDKLVFALCRMCMRGATPKACEHTDEERSFNGTYTTVELAKALDCGYVITDVYHAVEYKHWASDKNKNGGLFTSYINQMMVEKIYASGWPEEAKTDEQKKAFIQFSKDHEGIDVSDWTKFVKSPGRRQVAKLLLNSLWGKLAQKPDRSTTQIVINPIAFWKLFYDTTVVIEDVFLINDTVMIRHRKQAERLESLKTAAVHIAAYVTSYARLRLYKVMEMVGPENILYTDTDSIVYRVPIGSADPIKDEYGPNLGEMTNELKGEMTEFVTLAPKTYAYKETVNGRESVTRKTKGITLNSAADKKVTFDVMKKMVDEVLSEDPDRSLLQIPQQAVRRDRGHLVYFREQPKKLRYTFNKRRVLPDGSTLPYGFCDN